jgi:small subunit ribosomal protein S8
MSVTDPIADMLARLRNAHHALHRKVAIPNSKMKEALAGILKNQGYIDDFEIAERDLLITLKYAKGQPLISGLKRVSKPGRRIYVGACDIPRVQNGLGICILSTSQGVMDGSAAKTANVGGELLCEIW